MIEEVYVVIVEKVITVNISQGGVMGMNEVLRGDGGI
jgi:hypothetical protein